MRLEQIRSKFPILDKVDCFIHAGIAPIPRLKFFLLVEGVKIFSGLTRFYGNFMVIAALGFGRWSIVDLRFLQCAAVIDIYGFPFRKKYLVAK